MYSKSQVVVVASAALAIGAVLGSLSKRQLLSCCQQTKAAKDNVYESKTSLHEYLMMHYGRPEELMPIADGPVSALEFPKRCAQKCIELFDEKQAEGLRALDLGCAVGRASFELARFFPEVVGIDFSQSFVDAANHLKQNGSMPYTMLTEGEIRIEAEAVVDASLDLSRVSFMQGDACNLDFEKLGLFDVVLGANLVCRLPKPSKFLKEVGRLVKAGGYLVLPSPYTWLESFTPKSEWVGGYYNDKGEAVTSFEGFQALLSRDFELVEHSNMPFFIRETARKNQWSVSHCTVWKRK